MSKGRDASSARPTEGESTKGGSTEGGPTPAGSTVTKRLVEEWRAAVGIPAVRLGRQDKLVRQIQYTSVLRPTIRAAAMAVMLLPALHLGLESRADRLLLSSLGLLCSLNLLYAVGKFQSLRPASGGRLRGAFGSVITAAEVVLAVLGGVVASLAWWADTTAVVWVSTGALCLGATLALAAVLSVPRGWRVPDATARSMGREAHRDVAYEGTSIACSGGGIRAAAFCLGGLQRLRWAGKGEDGEPTLYEQSKRVFAVSGGGYVATALHLARRNSDPQVHRELFEPGSEEEEWLRRRSKYLLPSGARVAGTLSLLYGIAWTLALVVIAVYLAAWYVAWLLTRVGGACGVNSGGISPADCLETAGQAAFQPSEWWSLLMVGLLLSGLVVFVAMKTVSKYWPRGGVPAPTTTRVLVGAGIGSAAVGLLVPWLIVSLSNATLDNNPTELVAKAMAAARLATPQACEAATQRSLATRAETAWASAADSSEEISFAYGACGDTWTDDARVFAPGGSAITSLDCPEGSASNNRPVPAYCADRAAGGLPLWQSIPAWLAVVSALGAALRGLAKGLSGDGTGAPGAEKKVKPSRFAGLADSVRNTVLPWAAVIVLAFVVVLVLLNLTRNNMVDPGRLDSVPGLVLAAVLFLGIRFLSDAILSSLHPYYRERLSATFLIKRGEDGRARPLDYAEPTHLWTSSPAPRQSTTKPAEAAGPELTICCAVNISDPDYVPAARGCASFLFHTGRFVPPEIAEKAKENPQVLAPFANGAIGISDARVPPGRMQPAEAYSAASDPQGFDTTLAAAMATSGAAFSPLVGRKSSQVRPYRVLLALVNARLGVWLPNPYTIRAESTVAPAGSAESAGTWMRWAAARALRPGPFRLFKEAFGALSIYDERLYVTDGGHYDNTGIVEALRDRPAWLVVLDASADPRDSLDALGDAIVTARMDLGLVIKPFTSKEDVASLRGTVDKDGKYVAPTRGWMHLTAARVEEPDVPVTHIWFVKNVLIGEPDLELGTYAAEHPSFPSTSTSNQFYGEYDFEAYRLLGFTNTTAMMDAMKLFETERALLRHGGATSLRVSPPRQRAGAVKESQDHVPPV